MLGLFKRPTAPAPVVQIIDGLTPEHSAIAIAALQHRIKAIDNEIVAMERLSRHANERVAQHNAAANVAQNERNAADDMIHALTQQRVALEASIKGTDR